MHKIETPFYRSWPGASDFLAQALYPILSVAFVSTLLNLPMMPSLFLAQDQLAAYSDSYWVLLCQFVSIILSAWLTMFIWLGARNWFQRGSFWQQRVGENLEEALWATPGYLVFSMGFSFLLLLSFAALIFPALYVGPRFLFFPHLSALGLVEEGNGRLAFTHDLSRGHYFACLFFFVFFVLQEFYFAFLDRLVAHAPLGVVFLGLGAISFVGVFFEAWACLFTCELLEPKEEVMAATGSDNSMQFQDGESSPE